MSGLAESEKLTLIQKLAKIRKLADCVEKSKKGFGYSYADISEILAKVKAGMEKYNVSLIPEFVHGTGHVEHLEIRKAKPAQNGQMIEKVDSEMLVTSDMIYRWINNDNPSDMLIVPWFLAAQMEDAAQAEGAGLTYGLRQFLTNFFQIAQDNDVDKFRSKQKEAEQTEDRALAKGIIDEVHQHVLRYVSGDDGKREAVLKFMKRYVKNGDYRQITDPQVAAKLLQEFKEKFKEEES